MVPHAQLQQEQIPEQCYCPQSVRTHDLFRLGQHSEVFRTSPQLPPTKTVSATRISPQLSSATRTASSRISPSKGFVRNFTAPPRIACIRIFSSPCAVMKMVGIGL